ncbi:MAG: hypothetical protein AB7K68_13255 [Bacteriovoracia bacterium]
MNLVREFLRNYPYMNLVVCGELIFFAVFIAAIFWVFRRNSAAFYEQLARIPLEKNGDTYER